MANVTVEGANHSTVKLVFDSDANAALARLVAGAIQTGLADGSIQAADTKNGPAPPLPPGVTGELVVSTSGPVFVPRGYDFIVDSATSADIFGNGDPNQQVLVGRGNLSFFTAGGSGSVIGGGGNDAIFVAPSDPGNWLIALGDGNDSVRALGSGNDSISLGSGHDIIQLGAGSSFITSTGPDTVLASTGSETVDASGRRATDVIFGNASSLFFVAGGAATVFGGSGSDTIFGGTGRELFEGGSAGNNFLQAGDGTATLFGGGDGDQLFAGGNQAQALHAAGGNETLFGGFASGQDSFYGGSGSDQVFGGGGNNTFIAGTGSATVTANPFATNLFEFTKASGGGTEMVTGLFDSSQVHVDLSGYSSNEVTFALNHQTTTNGSVTITLTDQTQVTFQNVAGLSRDNFAAGNFGGGMGMHNDHDRDDGHGHRGRSDDSDHSGDSRHRS
jgi:Ca2+-binding RTX toxin-like protein